MKKLLNWLKANFSLKDSGGVSASRLLLNDYLVMQVCLGLEEIGALEGLRKGMDVNEFAKPYGKRAEYILTAVEFLWVATNWLERENSSFRLKKSAPINTVIDFTAAYKDVLDNIGPLIKGQKTYGKEVVRRGDYLARASVLTAQGSIRQALNLITEDRPHQLIDLGCGSAESLVYFCKKNVAYNGFGIDNDEAAIKTARENILRQGLGGRILLLHSDIRDLEKWTPWVNPRAKKVLLATMVFHEFLREGGGALIDLLKRIASSLPRARLFILEFDAPSYERLKGEEDLGKKLLLAQYELFHPLTNQGLPQPRSEWERIIAAGGWEIGNIIDTKSHLVIYDCFNYRDDGRAPN